MHSCKTHLQLDLEPKIQVHCKSKKLYLQDIVFNLSYESEWKIIMYNKNEKDDKSKMGTCDLDL